MKRLIKINKIYLLCCFLVFLCLTVVLFCSCKKNTEIKVFTINYLTTEGGYIAGEANQSVKENENATEITALPYEGYRFKSWSDGNANVTRQETNVNSNITVTAIFEKLSFSINYETDGNGTIDGNANQTVEYGENATAVIAIPNEGYRFVGWTDGLETVARQERNVNADITVTATFEKITYTVTYVVSSVYGHIEGQGRQTVAYGEDCTAVTAVPNTGYKFVKWSDGNTNPTRQETNVNSNITVTAAFEKLSYFVIYKTDGNGTISGETSQTVAYGKSSASVTAIPNEGYRFVEWTDKLKTATRQEKNVNADITVTAAFEKITYTVTYSTDGNGIIDGNTKQTVAYKESGSEVTAIPNEGYKFVRWNDGKETSNRVESGVTCDKTYTAIFEKMTYTLKYTTDGNGTIAGNTEQTVEYGEQATSVTATANEGYKFVKWSDGLGTATRSDRNITSHKTVTAEFARLVYSVTYETDGNGTIEIVDVATVDKVVQRIVYGGESFKVKVTPIEGYYFVKWSDTGNTDNIRQDIGIKQNINAVAIFEKIKFTVTYIASENGFIEGEANQSVAFDESTIEVKAIANEGYRFVKWSDTENTNPIRHDINVKENIEACAIFERLYLTVTFSTSGYTYLIVNDEEYYGFYEQIVEYGGSTEVVKAATYTDVGVSFLYWSDGCESVERKIENVTEDLRIEAIFGIKLTYKVEDGRGGIIQGPCTQIIKDGEDAESVTAIADKGYEFGGWSDLELNNFRQEKGVERSLEYIAYFELVEKTFAYNYGDNYGSPLVKEVSVKRNNIAGANFVVPTLNGYMFKGWYADNDYSLKVVNDNGRLMLGYYTFNLDTNMLYAKWQRESQDQPPIYKVLMVYTDEVKATLFSTIKQSYVDVNYKMSGLERRIYGLVPERLQNILNEWLAGIVTFEFDIYFTTQQLDEEAFDWGWDSTHNKIYDIRANNIKEIEELLDSYHTIIVSHGMNDKERVLNNSSGGARLKYASVNLDDFFGSYIIKPAPLQSCYVKYKNDSSYCPCANLYLHEFTHTIESHYDFVPFFPYHKIPYTDTMEGTKLYLLGIAEADGKLVGIPREFWCNASYWDEYWYAENIFKEEIVNIQITCKGA